MVCHQSQPFLQRQTREIEAVIDTGYNGFLTLPTATVAELQLPFLGPSRATLANGAVE